MADLKIGDVVARKSYGSDILFKVVDIKKEDGKKIVTLQGLCYRLEADAPESDLILQSESFVRDYNAKVNKFVEMTRGMNRSRNDFSSIGIKKKYYREANTNEVKNFQRPGKVLHIDADSDYLKTCTDQYEKLGIPSVGVHIKEKDQPNKVYDLLMEHRPDILVLTGHDGFIKEDKNYMSIDNYRNSRYFINAVKEARRYENDLDNLVIFAGACQSMYNEIIKAGANYASAPYRVLIHALDPVFVCQKIALTSIDKTVDPQVVVRSTITGVKGIGGVETRGKYRYGYPLEPYK